MAAVVNDFGPFIVALGPVKAEVARVSSVNDADTYSCRLQRPLFACYIPTVDENTTAQEVNCAISGKTVTFNNSNLDGTVSGTGVLLVVGF